MKHYVYLIRNKKTGSIYVGSRSHPTPEKDEYMGSSKLLKKVIEVQGGVNFEKIILAKFSTRKEANSYETLLVEGLLHTVPGKCYNKRIPGKPSCEKQHNIRADIWNDYFEEIRNEYKRTPNMTSLARKYNTSTSTIKKVVQDIQIKGYRPDVWDALELIQREYENGTSLSDLSIKYRCDIGTIKAVLLQKGIHIRTYAEQYRVDTNLQQKQKQQTVHVDMGEVKRLYFEENMNIGQIAKKLGLYRGTLEKRVRSAGIEIRNNSYYREKRHSAWNHIEDIQRDSKILSKKDLCEKYNIKDRSTLKKLLTQTKQGQ